MKQTQDKQLKFKKLVLGSISQSPNAKVCTSKCQKNAGVIAFMKLTTIYMFTSGIKYVLVLTLVEASRKLFSCASPLCRTAARRREEIKECFTNVKQVSLFYLWGSLMTLELISLIPLVGSLEVNPLAVKLLDNPPYMSEGEWKVMKNYNPIFDVSF